MKRFLAAAVVLAGLTGTSAYVAAQPYYGDGYRERSYDDRDRRDRDYRRGDDRRSDYDRRDRDYDRRDRGGYDDRDRGRGRGASFDEREYLRCNPDVRRAVSQGKFGGSGFNHYQEYGRRENRRLSC